MLLDPDAGGALANVPEFRALDPAEQLWTYAELLAGRAVLLDGHTSPLEIENGREG